MICWLLYQKKIDGVVDCMFTVYLLIDIIIAYFLDLIAGDPYWLPHPVRFIGWLIKRCESMLRRFTRKAAAEDKGKCEKAAGAVLMVLVVSVTFMIVFMILKIAGIVHPVLFHVLNIYFIYTALATKCLADEAGKVYKVLLTGDLPKARKQLSMLVGRQTEQLTHGEVAKGVIETTAENTVDGIVSPLIYAIIGSFFGLGAPLAYAFKAVSTLDSMVGYMNEKYLYFGRVSAKTDDIANFIPARISGLLIPFGALLSGLDFSKSFRIMKRDRHNHKSPNCAYPEAAFAGALGIRIGGTNIYFGRAVEKPVIGDADKEISTEDIPKAVRLMYMVSLITLILGLSLAFIFIFIRR